MRLWGLSQSEYCYSARLCLARLTNKLYISAVDDREVTKKKKKEQNRKERALSNVSLNLIYLPSVHAPPPGPRYLRSILMPCCGAGGNKAPYPQTGYKQQCMFNKNPFNLLQQLKGTSSLWICDSHQIFAVFQQNH